MRVGVVGTATTAAAAGLVAVVGVLVPTAAATPPVGQMGHAITAIASSPISRTLAIRSGHVDWLSLHPTRWTSVELPTRFDSPARGSMRPTAIAVTNAGEGLVGMSDGVVLGIPPGARHASARVVADYMPGRVVALAGHWTLGHLQLLVSTSSGTYSVGLTGALAVWWPHRTATAVVAPAYTPGTWAGIVAGRLAWAATPAPGGKGLPACAQFAPLGGPQPKPLTRSGRCAMPGGPAARWTLASSAYLGRGALLAESPDGTVAIATRSGAVLTGFPGEGLNAELHTVAPAPLGTSARPMGLVETYSPSGVGNVLALAANGTPLLVDGWTGWETFGGPVRTRLAAGLGPDVLEVQPSGSLRVVNLQQPGVAYAAPQRPVPSWAGPALGGAALLVVALLLALAARRLPWRPRRVAVFTVAGVVLAGFGGAAIGRFVIPPAARYTEGQLQRAWHDGADAGASGSWLLTPSQCHVLTAALGWKGPIPTTLTTTVAPDGPAQAVPACEVLARQSVAQHTAAMRRPLDEKLNQGSISYFLYLNLGSNATGAVQAASQVACSRLRGTCRPSGANGHLLACYAVQILLPEKGYHLWQKMMGWVA